MLKELTEEILEKSDPLRAKNLQRFFKTGPGDYGEGDKFLGITVPEQRFIAKKYQDMPIKAVIELLHGEWHEQRLTALFILNRQFEKGSSAKRKLIFDLYLANTKYINSWDLVDSSAYKIVGPFLADRSDKMKILKKLAVSNLMWERRIAIVSTLYNSGKLKSAEETIELAKLLLNDDHDLMHKAVGWTLREVGKQVDEQILLDFLDEFAIKMPRTALRYSIERLSPQKRQYYLKMKTS
jgi:3-methyladenine DNA glycosylase AlkD